jgi:hypothetical protein
LQKEETTNSRVLIEYVIDGLRSGLARVFEKLWIRGSVEIIDFSSDHSFVME